MSQDSATPGAPSTNYRWVVCALLFFATTVNYLDRQVLSLLAPDLSTQFGWSNTDYANIASVFQFVYAISMLFAGRFVDKIGTKTAYVVAIGIWSTGAMMAPTFVPELNTAVAVARSRLGNQRATALIADGKLPPSPRPRATRAT